MDNISSFCIRNHTNDTLFIELSTSDTLDNLIYYFEHSNERPIVPKDTTRVYINEKEIILDNLFYALPDSIYAIKWQVATQYTMEEIRATKLYDRQTDSN